MVRLSNAGDCTHATGDLPAGTARGLFDVTVTVTGWSVDAEETCLSNYALGALEPATKNGSLLCAAIQILSRLSSDIGPATTKAGVGIAPHPRTLLADVFDAASCDQARAIGHQIVAERARDGTSAESKGTIAALELMQSQVQRRPLTVEPAYPTPIPPGGPPSVLGLPEKILEMVCDCLGPRSKASIRLVCRRFWHVARPRTSINSIPHLHLLKLPGSAVKRLLPHQVSSINFMKSKESGGYLLASRIDPRYIQVAAPKRDAGRDGSDICVRIDRVSGIAYIEAVANSKMYPPLSFGSGGILADEPGLGKTVVAIAVMLESLGKRSSAIRNRQTPGPAREEANLEFNNMYKEADKIRIWDSIQRHLKLLLPNERDRAIFETGSLGELAHQWPMLNEAWKENLKTFGAAQDYDCKPVPLREARSNLAAIKTVESMDEAVCGIFRAMSRFSTRMPAELKEAISANDELQSFFGKLAETAKVMVDKVHEEIENLVCRLTQGRRWSSQQTKPAPLKETSATVIIVPHHMLGYVLEGWLCPPAPTRSVSRNLCLTALSRARSLSLHADVRTMRAAHDVTPRCKPLERPN